MATVYKMLMRNDILLPNGLEITRGRDRFQTRPTTIARPSGATSS
jgi:hypothetical protein